RERSYEVIQVHNMPDFLVFAGLFQKLSGKPVVLDLHDLSVELFRSKWGTRSSTLLEPLVRAVEKLSCSFADELITTSAGFKESLVRRGVREDKITLVLNTADSTIFSYQTNREFKAITRGVKLLYHGTVAERFGLLKAVEAVHLLQNLIPGTTLT